jgi:hypothetical protein
MKLRPNRVPINVMCSFVEGDARTPDHLLAAARDFA